MERLSHSLPQVVVCSSSIKRWKLQRLVVYGARILPERGLLGVTSSFLSALQVHIIRAAVISNAALLFRLELFLSEIILNFGLHSALLLEVVGGGVLAEES